jgi:hypothetical protein
MWFETYVLSFKVDGNHARCAYNVVLSLDCCSTNVGPLGYFWSFLLAANTPPHASAQHNGPKAWTMQEAQRWT